MKLSGNARKLVALTLSAALVLGGVAMNGSSASAAKKATLKLNKKSAKLTVGKKLTLKVTKKNVKSAKITWKSSKKAVASVSKKGVVKAKKAGKTKISATIKYKAKGSKKTQKKTLKCTVTVTKKNTIVTSKAPAVTKEPDATKTPGGTPSTPTPTPNGNIATPTPDGDTSTPTPTPNGDTATPTPAPGDGTATPTPAPGGDTATPTPAPGGDTSTPAPKTIQSLKISIMNGENILDVEADKITVKNAAGTAITVTKADDKTFTTEKLAAGTYTVSVAAVTIGNVSYNALEKEVTIAESATTEVQEVSIDLAYVISDQSYSASAKIEGEDGKTTLLVSENNNIRFQDVFSKGCLSKSQGSDTEVEQDWLVVDLSKIDTSGMYSPYITITVSDGGDINKVNKNDDGKYSNIGYYNWKQGAFSLTSADLKELNATGLAMCNAKEVKIDLVDKNALPTWNEAAIPESVTLKDGEEYRIDLGLKFPIEGQSIDEKNINFAIQCTAQDNSYQGDYAVLITGTYENGVVKITPNKETIQNHVSSCKYHSSDMSKCKLLLYVPMKLSDGTTEYHALNYTINISFSE